MPVPGLRALSTDLCTPKFPGLSATGFRHQVGDLLRAATSVIIGEPRVAVLVALFVTPAVLSASVVQAGDPCTTISRTRDIITLRENQLRAADSHSLSSSLEAGEELNAFSVVHVGLASSANLDCVRDNLVLVAELRKRGESTWLGIAVSGRFVWSVESSVHMGADDTDRPDDLAADHETPAFYVRDEILAASPYVRTGDDVVVLFFDDVTREKIYTQELQVVQRDGDPFLSLDLSRLYLLESGNAPQQYAAQDGDALRIRILRAQYSIYRGKEIESVLAAGKRVPRRYKYADIISPEDVLEFPIEEFGFKLNVSPIIAFGNRTSRSFEPNNFNPVKTTPSAGSNIYLSYDGRSPYRNALVNVFPIGLHVSLLGLAEPTGADFTLGVVSPIIPGLRDYFGVFLGWQDLEHRVWGLSFSPLVDFKALIAAERPERKGRAGQR